MRGWEAAQRNFFLWNRVKHRPKRLEVLDLRGFELLWDQTLQFCETVVILFKERYWDLKKKKKERGRNVHLLLVVKGREGQGRGAQKRDPNGWFVCIQSSFTNPLLRVLGHQHLEASLTCRHLFLPNLGGQLCKAARAGRSSSSLGSFLPGALSRQPARGSL